MSLPLHDVRCKLPTDLHAVLEAIAKASGRDKSVVVREYATERLSEALALYRSIHSELKAVGMEYLIEDSRGVEGRK
jgi:predicted DNA-binding protein